MTVQAVFVVCTKIGTCFEHSYGMAWADMISSLRIRSLTNIDSRFTIDVDDQVPVSTLKLSIQERTGVLLQHQRLVFRSQNLDDSRILCSYGLCEGDEIHLIDISSVVLQVRHRWQTHEFAVPASITLRILRQRLASLTAVVPCRQVLLIGGFTSLRLFFVSPLLPVIVFSTSFYICFV